MARSARKRKALVGAPVISAYTIEPPLPNGHTSLELPQREAHGHFIAKILALLDGQEVDLTQEETWEQLARLVVKHWALFDAQQSSLSTMRMLKECAEMKLRIRVANQKAPTAADEDILASYESLMEAVFAPEDAPVDVEDSAGDDPAD